ncbi:MULTISPECIES: M24 family metallopeptidase [Phyllobacteriaceae]|jgi:Xaa-Pro dipeptidase|uniref:Peptidase M24 n=3 Tax=Pseudomonadota TaxID=1224 RepID=A0A1C2DNG8_9HYPH|nr:MULTISPECIES: Xaa-Pro peptidase family protein [Mesorhizobium]MBN9233780.1 aminopeptidase P family protein [Mesorhizobium sp.]MDQ0328412.1 Xaa-Pro aminopeptidase [Mesorhizobium sp. YL-MeA3-2017]OCX16318.1 peptidase M24 [Mesorhizobium hungaricum]
MNTGTNFGRHRKIMPFEPGGGSSPSGSETLRSAAREKAAALNQHVLGYGPVAEAEWAAAGIPAPDLPAMRKYRLERIRAELKRRDYAGALLYDPVNIRYATDSTNMQLWVAHNPTRHCFVATEGPVVLFDYFSCEHLSDHSGVVDEVRPAVSWMYLYGGELTEQRVKRWAAGIADLVREHGGGNRRIAVDHLNPEGMAELAGLGITIGNGEAVMENARLIKSPDEVLCMHRAIVACEAAMGEMEAALKPGISENELWAELHRGNIARGGEWIETRLLSSGPRTNPWFQECSSRKIEAGDLVAFDTDLIGPYGFCADLSRTWLAGDGRPGNEQHDLYRIAAEQIAHNTELMQPGTGFRELAERSKNPPDDCFPARYGVLYHGVGLADEYPTLPHAADWIADTPDGVLQPGMVLCVESYIGRLGGHEGVKIEEQVLITETGNRQLSAYPLDERLLAG